MPEGLRVPRGSGRELDQSGIPAVSYVRLKGRFKEMCRFNLPWRHQRALAQVPFPCIDGYPAFRRERMDFRPSTSYLSLFGANVTFPVWSIFSSRAEKQLLQNLQLRTLAFWLTWLRALFPWTIFSRRSAADWRRERTVYFAKIWLTVRLPCSKSLKILSLTLMASWSAASAPPYWESEK